MRKNQTPQQLITQSDSAAPRQHPLICTGAEPIHPVHGPPKLRAHELMLRNRIHIFAIFPPRMIHEIEEIDHLSATPLASTRLHELRLKNISLRGSYGGSQSAVGVAAALAYFKGKSSKEKSNMIIKLLQTLSMKDQDSQTPKCLSTVLCSSLHARDKVSEIMTTFSDDIVRCNPLENMVTALT